MTPKTLEEWTFSALIGLLRIGIFESDGFDFKEALPRPGDEASKRRLRKTCAAFANSLGGFLVFGVKDERDLNPEARLVGLESSFDFPREFGNFPSNVEPSVEWRFQNPAIELSSGRVVHVVHIPRSARAPHGVVVDDKWSFPKRTSRGTEHMSYDELRFHFRDTSRLVDELTWLQSELARIRDLAQRFNIELYYERWTPDLLATRFKGLSRSVLNFAVAA